MILESTIAIAKIVGYLYAFFVIILIGMIGIAGLVRVLVWLIKDSKIE